MVLYNDIKKNTYYDSITLMLFSGELSAAEGVESASVMMGTEHNKSIMMRGGILSPEAAAEAGPNDMVVGIRTQTQEQSDAAVVLLRTLFEKAEKKEDDGQTGGAANRAKTLAEAVRNLKDPNFAVVSVPGKYAAFEAMKAMHKGLHVLLFSDNVSLEEENRLKEYAVEHELLLMGPDCGTAWVNGVALGFANEVRRGNIGLAAASGTGLQEVCVHIDRLGGGISQALGTGGRDVKDEVGGKMLMMELKALEADPETRVIGIVSKPPADRVLRAVIDLCATFTKPVVACFLGGSRELLKGSTIGFADDMEQAAAMLVGLSRDGVPVPLDMPDLDAIVDTEVKKYTPAQRYIRGLYSGGSLCYEGILLAEREAGRVYSNISSGESALKNVEKSEENTYIDMGEDYFTDGMPHPMIDTRLRVERLKKEAGDETVAAIVLDCVLGYGCNEDPAGALAAAVTEARTLAAGRHITFMASICGTDQDPQKRSQQAETLRKAGVMVLDSNAQCARLAARLMKRLGEER